jgi:hypothetical protein
MEEGNRLGPLQKQMQLDNYAVNSFSSEEGISKFIKDFISAYLIAAKESVILFRCLSHLVEDCRSLLKSIC